MGPESRWDSLHRLRLFLVNRVLGSLFIGWPNLVLTFRGARALPEVAVKALGFLKVIWPKLFFLSVRSACPSPNELQNCVPNEIPINALLRTTIQAGTPQTSKSSSDSNP